MEAIKHGCYQYDADYKPKFIFVIGTKRHFKKFFTIRDGRVGNLDPGSVIAETMVREDVPEFFMQSHYPLKALFSYISGNSVNNVGDFRELESRFNTACQLMRLESARTNCRQCCKPSATLIRL